MRCKNCGHDVEAMGVSLPVVQATMARNPCCAEPDYSLSEEQVLKELIVEYLDAVRDSGLANMMSVVPSLEAEFGLTRKEAISALAEWITTFDERHPPRRGGRL